MKITKISVVAIFLASVGPLEAFTNPCKTAGAIGSSVYTSAINVRGNNKVAQQEFSSLFPRPRSSQKLAATAVLSPQEGSSNIKGGFLSFKTKLGYLNPFAIYYGLTSILLGIPWFVVLTMCQFMYKITNNKWDKMKRVPIFFSHIWGYLLLRLTNCMPEVEGLDILEKFYKE